MKCDRNSADPEAYHNLNSSFHSLVGCFKNLFAQTSDTCKMKKSSMLTCLEKLIVDLKQCLSDDEDSFPQFLRDSVTSAVDYLCEEERLHYFRASSGLQCLSETNMEPLHRCLDSARPNKLVDGEVILKESLICKYLNTTGDCLTTHLLVNCPNDRLFKSLVHGSFQSLQAPCSGGTSVFLNNALLAGLILFYVRKLWY